MHALATWGLCASNVESNEGREEKLRRRKEHDRLGREMETDEEGHAKFINANLRQMKFCNSTSYRLARHREYCRTERQGTMEYNGDWLLECLFLKFYSNTALYY